jgi:hypothetical protein
VAAHVDAVEKLPGFFGGEHRGLPRFTTCFGPRTAVAGLKGRMPPVASQSNIIRMAARCRDPSRASVGAVKAL